MRLAAFALIPLGCCVLLGQQSSPDPVTVRDPGPLPTPESLKIPPLGKIHVPKPVVFTLSNGLKVYMLEDHELPVVRGTLLVRTGNLFDPAAKRGLASLTGVTMRSGGTASLTGDQLDEKLESIAASVETGIGESTGTVRFRCLRENTDVVLQLLRDVLVSPAFRQDKIDLVKLQVKSAISRRNDDAAGIANRELLRQVYGPNTPYGGMEEYATIDAVTRPDILAFYQRYFFPANMLMAVYGDFSAPDMQKKLEATLGSWTAKQDKVPAFPKVDVAAAPGVFVVQKPDVEQSFIEIGELGGELRDKDYPALSVAADVFGSGFSSRLMREVRSRLGYAYAISADWEAAFDHPGLFRIAGSTKTQTTTETVQAVLSQLDRLRTSEITDQELKTAKDAVLNGLVFEFERPSSTLSRLISYDYFGYPEDFLTRYQEAVAAVTKADVLRVVKEHFLPDKLTIVAVGNQSQLGKPLAALNLPVKQLDVSIPSAKQQRMQ